MPYKNKNNEVSPEEFSHMFTGKTDKEKPNNVKWKERLLSLDTEKQKQIAFKYYGGVMPWKDTKSG